MYVVLGANGRVGGEVARTLIERGEAVRVVLRRKEQGERWVTLGAEVAAARIEDVDAMAAALQGAEAAFLLNPPPVSGDPYALAAEHGAALADAIRRARLPRAVILSSIGAQHVSGTGVIATLNRFEALLEGAAPATAFLRSGYFVETWSEVAQAVLSDSVLPTFIEPSLKIPMVSTVDVGRMAATLLCEEWTGKRVVELGGPQDWSAGDVTSAFAQVLGRAVALLGMYEGIANGLFARENSSEHRRGTVSLATAVERLVARLGR